MSEQKWSPAGDAGFEAELRESLPEQPPEEMIREVTPWRTAMDRVLTGLALTVLTFDFLCLNYILPAVGLVLMLLGFRTLRRENGWFRGCFIIAVFRSLYFFPSLILNATVLREAAEMPQINSWLTAASLLLTLAQFVCLWRGLRAVKAGAGLPEEAGAAAALIVWYLVIALLALWGAGGVVAGIIMVVACVLILRGLCRLSSELDEAGYAVKAAPVRVSDRALARVIAGALAVGIACGYLFFGGYRMDWAPVSAEQSAETEEIKARLLGLGFPEEVLDDLEESEILDCAGALQVVTEAADLPVNAGREVVEYEDGGEYHYTVYDQNELRITGVAVELLGGKETWKVFHHFRWVIDPGFRGTESIQLWPASMSCEGWDGGGEVTGRLLYTLDGTDYCAPYHSLGSRDFTSSSVIWGEQTATNVFGEFSLPNRGGDQRGYLCYTVTAHYTDIAYIINSWANYTHQTGWLQYPVKTAAEYRMSGAWGDGGAFITVQEALQFYNTPDGIDMLNAD